MDDFVQEIFATIYLTNPLTKGPDDSHTSPETECPALGGLVPKFFAAIQLQTLTKEPDDFHTITEN